MEASSSSGLNGVGRTVQDSNPHVTTSSQMILNKPLFSLNLLFPVVTFHILCEVGAECPAHVTSMVHMGLQFSIR